MTMKRRLRAAPHDRLISFCVLACFMVLIASLGAGGHRTHRRESDRRENR